MTPLATLNALPEPDFTALLGDIYEHSPWVASRSYPQSPFTSRDHLVTTMRDVVDAASDAEKLTLIRAHPDLAGKLARAGKLTCESTREQAGLGLDRLSNADFQRFTDLNTRYRDRFGFPFVICARLTTKEGVLNAFQTRLTHTVAQETTEALSQIHHIARLRLEDLITP